MQERASENRALLQERKAEKALLEVEDSGHCNCTTLHRTAPHNTTLQHTATHSITLHELKSRSSNVQASSRQPKIPMSAKKPARCQSHLQGRCSFLKSPTQYIYIYICIYINIYMCIHIFLYKYRYIFIDMYIYLYMCIFYIDTDKSVFICI